MPIVKLPRYTLRIRGEAATDWLAGLVTNTLNSDINFAALLTPQGKIIADFFLIRDGEDWLIDTAEKYGNELRKRLTLYKLRTPVEILREDINVYALWEGEGNEGHIDPRNHRLGARLYGAELDAQILPELYDQHRLTLGIPDSHWDFDTAEIFPANANMDLLSGVDFKKGCFVGQEVVSRMYRKTEIRKRMRGIELTQALNHTGDSDGYDILAGERVVGRTMYVNGKYGMAMVRQDRLPDDETPLTINGQEVRLMDLPNGE